jgi:hypothetical protein
MLHGDTGTQVLMEEDMMHRVTKKKVHKKSPKQDTIHDLSPPRLQP